MKVSKETLDCWEANGWNLTCDPFGVHPEKGMAVQIQPKEDGSGGRFGFVNSSGLDGFGIRWDTADDTKLPHAMLRDSGSDPSIEYVGEAWRDIRLYQQNLRSSAPVPRIWRGDAMVRNYPDGLHIIFKSPPLIPNETLVHAVLTEKLGDK